MEQKSLCDRVQDCLNVFQGKVTIDESVQQSIIWGEITIQQCIGLTGPGKAAAFWLYSGAKVDPNTGKGLLSEKAHIKQLKSYKQDGIKITTYIIKFEVEPDFGTPGVFVIRNQHKNKFFLQSLTLQSPQIQRIKLDCNSWIYPFDKTESDQLFFTIRCYLPNQTPQALVELREQELVSLRGDGTKEMNEWDRFYEYDYYNDLGDPDRGSKYARPVLGGSDLYPYPRRGKTAHSSSKLQNSQAENGLGMIDLNVYFPPDEQLSPKRLSELITNSIQAAVHFVIPEAKSLLLKDSNHVESFEEMRKLFSCKGRQVLERKLEEQLKSLLPDELFKETKHFIKQKPIKFPLPQIIAENGRAWKDDEEFGRQMLAGINPTLIQCLQTFPPRSKSGVRSSIKVSDIEQNLEGLTIKEAMNQWRIFILDHHDYLMPFLDRINTKGVCAYASRTLLFLRNDSTLKPLAIELSLPGSVTGEEIHRVFLPASQGTEAALWLLAKTHVATNDCCYHQLINHWLKTHAVVEPFIIATRRQLSAMHPVHWLLEPHFKDTMHINALARRILINSGGILEKTLFTGGISMELSSALYKDWRFHEQSLPSDLLKRRMALIDTDKAAGVELLFEDYPYGADGLDIWVAIKNWVTNYCSLFYTDDESVKSDEEIQAWWSEIRNVGHGDKQNEIWWHSMTTRFDLIEALTTLIWIVSALHASVNFGQYAYAGYPPNRPAKCRKFVPKEGTLEFAEFLGNPDKYYLKTLPGRFEMTLGVALMEVLSKHTSDEVYLGQQLSLEGTAHEDIPMKCKQFSDELKEVEKKILERNKDPRLKNRWGPANIPCKLLYSDTSSSGYTGGITGMGIPNSISI